MISDSLICLIQSQASKYQKRQFQIVSQTPNHSRYIMSSAQELNAWSDDFKCMNVEISDMTYFVW